MGDKRIRRMMQRNAAPESDAEAQARIRRNTILQQITEEVMQRWPLLNRDNFAEANAWREARVRELFEAEGL